MCKMTPFIHCLASWFVCVCVSLFVSRWAVVHRDRLLAHGSCLEFKLRQLKFLSLLSGGQASEALAYAKVLGQFSPKHISGQFFLL